MNNDARAAEQTVLEKVRLALTEKKFSIIKLALPGHMLLLVIINFLFYEKVSSIKLVVYSTLIITIDIWGVVLFNLYKGKFQLFSLERWNLLYNLSCVVICIIWGSINIILLPNQSYLLQTSAIVIIFAFSTGFAANCAVIDSIASYVCLFFLLAPTFLWCCLQSHISYHAVSILILFYGIFLFYITYKSNILFKETLIGRFTNILLAEKLAEKNIELEQKFDERTNQLQKAKDEAEMANSAKTEFLTLSAHELKTPLQSINILLNIVNSFYFFLIDGYKLAKNYNYNLPYITRQQFERLPSLIVAIDKEVEAAENFMTMLLHTNTETKKLPRKYSYCSIGNCVRIAVERYPYKQGERELIIWDNKEDFLFQGNEILMVHVIFNLLRNAFQCIQEVGKGRIMISLEKANCKYILNFKDTAKGIDETSINNIFKKFYTNNNGGTGLGLAFCQMIMKSVGGKINCESKLGEYTKFILEFPILDRNNI